jgi:hypothetical protein
MTAAMGVGDRNDLVVVAANGEGALAATVARLLLDSGGRDVSTFDASLGVHRGGRPDDGLLDVVATVTAPFETVCRKLREAEASAALAGWVAYRGVESRRFDRSHATTAGERGRLRRLILHRRIDNITVAEYRSRFASHFLLTRDHMPLVSGYRQTDLDEREGSIDLPADGVSEFWFDSLAASRDPYGGDEAERAIVGEDSRLFVDPATAVAVNGYE